MRRTRALIAGLLLSLGLLGGYLAVLAQDAPWPPPPVKPLPPGMVAPTLVPVREIPDAPAGTSEEVIPVPPQEDPLPLEPGQEQKNPVENNVLPAKAPAPVIVTIPDNEPAPAPMVEVREVEEPAPKPMPGNGGSAPSSVLPIEPGPIRIIENGVSSGVSAAPPGLPPKRLEVKSVPAAPVHVAVPIRRYHPAPPPQPEVTSKGSNAPTITTEVAFAPKVQAPLLTIEKRGPTSVTLGQPVHYEIIVKNVGRIAASLVRVEDELPEKARFLGGTPQPIFQGGRVVWNLDEIPAGGEQRVQLDLEPGANGEMSGQTSLVLTIGSQTQVATAPLDVSITGPGRLAKESQGLFKIVLNNRSNRRLTNLTLHAQLPAGLLHPMGKSIEADIGELGPGASKDIDLRVTAAQPGRHTLVAIITVQGRQEASARANVFVGEPGLVLVQPATTRIQLDRPGNLNIEVANFHTRIVKSLSVTAAIPDGVEFEGANEGGRFSTGLRKVQWVLENLAPEETRTLTISVKGKIPGQFVNTVLAQAPEGLKTQVQGKVVVESLAQLTMRVSHRDEPLEVGHETVYEIRVGNQGNISDGSVQIVANVPDGMSAKSADGPTPYRIEGQQVIFEPLSRLDPNSQVIYKVGVLAQAPGDRRFRVQLTSANQHEPVTREERTMVYRD